MTKANGKAERTKPRTKVPRAKTPKMAFRTNASTDRTGHMKSDCQLCAEDMRKATSAGRPFVDKSKKVTALQTTDETPPFASATLAPNFDGYLFAITMDSSSSDTLCPLVRPPTALGRRRANTTLMSHGPFVFFFF